MVELPFYLSEVKDEKQNNTAGRMYRGKDASGGCDAVQQAHGAARKCEP